MILNDAALRAESFHHVWESFQLENLLDELNAFQTTQPSPKAGYAWTTGYFPSPAVLPVFHRIERAFRILELGYVVGAVSEAPAEAKAKTAWFLTLRKHVERLSSFQVHMTQPPPEHDNFPSLTFLRGEYSSSESFVQLSEVRPFSWLARLISLERNREHDRELNLFLNHAYAIQDPTGSWLLRATKRPIDFAQAIAKPAESRSDKEATMVGMERFLQFCSDLNKLSNSTSDGVSAELLLLYRPMINSPAVGMLVNSLSYALGGPVPGTVVPLPLDEWSPASEIGAYQLIVARLRASQWPSRRIADPLRILPFNLADWKGKFESE